jgi:hypothetical protein
MLDHAGVVPQQAVGLALYYRRVLRGHTMNSFCAHTKPLQLACSIYALRWHQHIKAAPKEHIVQQPNDNRGTIKITMAPGLCLQLDFSLVMKHVFHKAVLACTNVSKSGLMTPELHH